MSLSKPRGAPVSREHCGMLLIPGPGDLAAALARVERTVLVTAPSQPYERIVVEHQDLTNPPTPPPDWAPR